MADVSGTSLDVAECPVGLFPTADCHDPEWSFRVEHCAHLLGDSAGDTVRMMVRFMNAQLHHQELQCPRKLDRKIIQVEELQAAVTARDEDQIVESDAIISQRNIVIEFLQEQVQDLTSELEDANAYIEFLQVQLMPPDDPNEPAGNEEEDPEDIEGVSDLDSEHEGLEPEAQSSDLSLDSESSVGNLDDF
ncbi:hypothetical protein PVAP13_8KG169609 [Panicum virgatum]|uniref:Uncharacterized protein n=1 Tax=Panicum virgatum TaxID=38727 RepID=A0A8T0PHL4_PANVG|nr:hypothetical protein PVAP13_8KG169609 [Panicum virgatum]